MAIASLNRFTVPLATNQSASTQGLLMPKLKYRFRAVFENFGVSSDRVELTKQVNSISRPNVNFNPFVIEAYNSKVNLVGKPSWEPVTVTLRDDAGRSEERRVGKEC
jgi:xanthine dehydrogenase molybdopterin-binding subunit B